MTDAEREPRMKAGEPYALRLDMAAGHRARRTRCVAGSRASDPDGEGGAVDARPQAWGDVILARKDVPTSYHLSVVVDDALQGVTHVVRGQDLFWSTSVHRLLQTLLDLPAPVYRHHRLVLDADGRKLSKSTRATALRALRAGGATPADIRDKSECRNGEWPRAANYATTLSFAFSTILTDAAGIFQHIHGRQQRRFLARGGVLGLRQLRVALLLGLIALRCGAAVPIHAAAR